MAKKASVRGLKKVCSSVVRATGLKVDGTLKKGYKYVNGKPKKVVAKKAAPKKKAVKRKTAAPKKRVVKKKTAKRKSPRKTKK